MPSYGRSNIAIVGVFQMKFSTSNEVFRIDSSFVKKDHYFKAALEEPRQTFNTIMPNFRFHLKLEKFNPTNSSSTITTALLTLMAPISTLPSDVTLLTSLSSADHIFTSLSSAGSFFTCSPSS